MPSVEEGAGRGRWKVDQGIGAVGLGFQSGLCWEEEGDDLVVGLGLWVY